MDRQEMQLDIIQFINNTFWKDSAYFTLLVISLIYIWMKRKSDNRGFRLEIYSILVLFAIIWNPIVAKYGVIFFGEDMYAYLRIFYLLPLMTLLAYAVTHFLSHYSGNGSKKKTIVAFLMFAFIISLSGKVYDKSMYQKVSNIYKIDQDALEISDMINADSGNSRVYAVIPEKEEIYYGIRQYTSNIIIAGTVEKMEEVTHTGFEYLVVAQENVKANNLAEFDEIGRTDHYMIYRRMET